MKKAGSQTEERFFSQLFQDEYIYDASQTSLYYYGGSQDALEYGAFHHC